MLIEDLSTDNTWVYDDPLECYDMATYLQDIKNLHKVSPIEDPQNKAVGFLLSNGMQILYQINFFSGNPKSKFYNPFTPLLLDINSRKALAQCISERIGNIGNFERESKYIRDKRELQEYKKNFSPSKDRFGHGIESGDKDKEEG